MSWSMRLIRPVVPSNGKPIVTLSDARAYALALPKSEQDAPHVQAGISVLLLAADGHVPDLVAQSAVAHIVHGPQKPFGREKPDRPWMKRKSRA